MTRHRYLLLAALALAAPLAGCGSGSNSSGSSTSPSSGGHLTPTQFQQEALNFATCMRSHGVPNFPDPTSSGVSKQAAVSALQEVTNSQAEAAQTACQHLQPGGGPPNQSPVHSQAQLTAMLAFARCIRSHGFPRFPDPTSGGELSHEMLANAGINVHLPAMLQAADACVSVTHGLITKAVVARFVAGH